MLMIVSRNVIDCITTLMEEGEYGTGGSGIWKGLNPIFALLQIGGGLI